MWLEGRKKMLLVHFIIWLDNCSAQNKNWALYTMLTKTVNEAFGPDEVILRYLTAGHTHMDADSVHGHMEKN